MSPLSPQGKSSVAANIAQVRENIEAHAVKFIAVTKHATIQQVEEAFTNGVKDFAENRLQDAQKRRSQLPEFLEQNSTWHFIGHLQTNKVKQVVGNFSLIQSVDSLKLALEINRVAKEKGICQSILLQVKMMSDPAKTGFTTEEVTAALPELLKLTNIKIEGLMTITPQHAGKEETAVCFCGLKAFQDKLEKDFSIRLPHLSMGMSDDYKEAIASGSTMIRLGRAIFGN